MAAISFGYSQDTKPPEYQKDSRYLNIMEAKAKVLQRKADPSNLTVNTDMLNSLLTHLSFLEWTFDNSAQKHVAVTKNNTIVDFLVDDANLYVKDTVITIPVPASYNNYVSYLFRLVIKD